VTGPLELADIQGLVVRGYSNLRAACFFLLGLPDAPRGRSWLGELAPGITTGDQRPERRAVHVALTVPGLRALGVDDATLGQLSESFLLGMTTPDRSRAFGDVGDSAPERWAWGGPDEPAVGAALLLYANDEGELAGLVEEQVAAVAAAGLTVIARLDTHDLGDREHFGFHDGISQPLVEGLSRTGTPESTVRAGEFVIGYPNEYGQLSPAPDVARNGTYLVFRQLAQDVAGFWSFCEGAAGDGQDAVALAAKMVGRWPSGAPLALSPDHDDPALANANDFGYFRLDPFGRRCPLGSHIRRANPRDSLDPRPGSGASIAVGKRHRIVRRGREYGSPDGDGERGLHFICLNASIDRQFEFLQRTWIANPNFNGLRDDADPLLAAHEPFGATFTIQAAPVRKRYRNVPRFVTVRGGAYFLLPGISALHAVSGG
jgi:Dyp-type peroxidase family